MTDISEQPAFFAQSSFDSPRTAASSAIRCTSYSTFGLCVDIADTTIPTVVYCVNNNLQRESTTSTLGAVAFVDVRERPVFDEEMASFFKGLRTSRGWNQKQAAEMARRRGLPSLSRQILLRLEKGQTKNPEPGVLKAVAALYEVPYADVVHRYMEHKFGFNPASKSATDDTAAVAPARGTFATNDPPTFRYVAVMKDRIAAGQALTIEDGNVDGAIAFAERSLRKWKKPLCVRVGKGEESMIGAGIMPNDVVLLECSDEARLKPAPDRIYAVRVDGGATLKKVELLRDGGRTWLVLMSENPNKDKYGTRIIAVNEDETLLDYIVGRVVWHGQYL